MTRHLSLLEAGVDASEVSQHLQRLGKPGRGSLVVSEDPVEAPLASSSGVAVKYVGDFVPLSGVVDGQLFELAARLTDAWVDQVQAFGTAEFHTYGGLSLWEIGRLSQEYVIFRALRRIETIRAVLTTGEWDVVHVVGNEGGLWSALRWAADEIGSPGNFKPTGSPRGRSLKGHLLDLVAAGWGGGILEDLRGGMRTCRPDKGRRTSRGQSSHLCVVGRGGHYLQTILPVIERLRASASVLVLNAGGSSSASLLRQRGIPPSYCSQFLPPGALPRVAKRTRALHEAWRAIERDERFSDFLSYRGRSLWPILRAELRRLYLHAFPRMMLWIEAASRVFSTARPSSVLTVPDRYYPERIILALAKKHGVPSLTIQPALINDGSHYGPMYADKAAVIDDFSREIYIRRGKIDPARVVVTGLPRWDDIPGLCAEATLGTHQSALRQQFGLEPRARVITFATENVSPNLTRRMILAVAACAARYRDVRLVVKLHPAEPFEFYEQVAQEPVVAACRPLVTKDANLHALLATSELVVAWFSNVVLEAALLDRMVLVVNLSGEPDPIPFVAQGIALGAYTEEQVKAQLDRIILDPAATEELRHSRQRYLARNPQLLDGHATKRIVALLEEMAARDGTRGQRGDTLGGFSS